MKASKIIALIATLTLARLLCLDTSTGRIYPMDFEWPNYQGSARSLRIYYGLESGKYDQTASIGIDKPMSCEIAGLLPSKRYYLTATLIDDLGLESEFSPELHRDAEMNGVINLRMVW